MNLKKFFKEIRSQFIKIAFMEEHSNILKTHSTISKKAGKFISEMIKNNITNIENAKKHNF